MSEQLEISPDLLKKLERGAAQVRHAGDALTKRIRAFEEWMSGLPGRVEASHRISTNGPCSTHLAAEKNGKEWRLTLYDFNEYDGETQNERLLRDASVADKAAAIFSLPELLSAMAKQQEFLASFAAESAQKFDEFAKTIGMKEGA